MMEDRLLRPICKEALFADETEGFRFPPEPDVYTSVRLRFRTAKDDVDKVYLVSGQTKTIMIKKFSDYYFDYYETDLNIYNEMVTYYFEIVKGQETCRYNRLGVSENLSGRYLFRINPGFHVPQWAKGAVIYQIYTDRFFNGDPGNDVVDGEYLYLEGQPVKKVDNWEEYPEALDVDRFYGGDLKGVMDKLDYLCGLGIDAIYFNPLFVSPSNHKYDIQDYDNIDPHYGVILEDGKDPVPFGDSDNLRAEKYKTRVMNKRNLEASNQLFAQLVEECHKRGIRVIIDGVFNHCGSFNKWMDRERLYENHPDFPKGAYVSADSPYRSYFDFYREDWPYNDKYRGWWDYPTLPKLNYENAPELGREIMKIGSKWVSKPYCVDGWRLDVAADLGHSEEYNHKFWKEFRRSVKKANPEAVILAEHYGDAGSWLEGDEWDTIMNYDAFMEPVGWFLTGMEKHSDFRDDGRYNNADIFFNTMRYQACQFGGASLLIAMNELSNHDHSRFLTRTNRMVGRTASLGPEKANEGVSKAVMMAAVMIQMTWPGAPTIYYGDEAGLCGWTDPDSRRTYPWGKEDFELIEFHRYMIAIHHRHPALMRGSLVFLYGAPGVIAYGRFLGKNRLAVIVNNSEEEKEIRVPLWKMGVCPNDRLVRRMLTYPGGYNIGKTELKLEEDGCLLVTLKPKNAMLVRSRQG